MKKQRLNHQIRIFCSKHFATHLFPDCCLTVDSSLALAFWEEKSLQVKQQMIYFVCPPLIDLVNKVNTKLLYSDLVEHK